MNKIKKTKPDLSLIICSRNRAESLKKCLKAINPKEMLEVNAELILVNNGSTDSTEKVMREFKKTAGFPVKVLNEPKEGLSKARNLGVSNAEGDVFVFTDDDCYLGKRYLKKVKEVFKSSDLDYCGGQILLHNKKDAEYGINYFDSKTIIPQNTILHPGQIQGCNMVFHRRVWEKIGKFDELLGLGTWFPAEDIDFVTRASLAGFKGTNLPELVVFHAHGRNQKDVENLIKHNAFGIGAYYTKLLLSGKPRALKEWLKFHSGFKKFIKDKSLKEPSFLLGREILGGAQYLLTRVQRAIA